MSTNRLSPSRLTQCRELEYILIGDLRDLLDEPPTEETRHWMTSVLDALLKTIPEEYDLKSGDGYLQSVLEDFPNWEGQVTRLEEEYFALYRQLLQLRRTLQDQQDFSRIAAELSRKLQDWMDAFKNHIQSEQQLVMLAANLEVGGGD